MTKRKDPTKKQKTGRKPMFTEPAVRRLLTIPTSVYERIPGSKSVFVTEAVVEKLDKDRQDRKGSEDGKGKTGAL